MNNVISQGKGKNIKIPYENTDTNNLYEYFNKQILHDNMGDKLNVLLDVTDTVADISYILYFAVTTGIVTLEDAKKIFAERIDNVTDELKKVNESQLKGKYQQYMQSINNMFHDPLLETLSEKERTEYQKQKDNMMSIVSDFFSSKSITTENINYLKNLFNCQEGHEGHEGDVAAKSPNPLIQSISEFAATFLILVSLIGAVGKSSNAHAKAEEITYSQSYSVPVTDSVAVFFAPYMTDNRALKNPTQNIIKNQSSRIERALYTPGNPLTLLRQLVQGSLEKGESKGGLFSKKSDVVEFKFNKESFKNDLDHFIKKQTLSPKVIADLLKSETDYSPDGQQQTLKEFLSSTPEFRSFVMDEVKDMYNKRSGINVIGTFSDYDKVMLLFLQTMESYDLDGRGISDIVSNNTVANALFLQHSMALADKFSRSGGDGSLLSKPSSVKINDNGNITCLYPVLKKGETKLPIQFTKDGTKFEDLVVKVEYTTESGMEANLLNKGTLVQVQSYMHNAKPDMEQYKVGFVTDGKVFQLLPSEKTNALIDEIDITPRTAMPTTIEVLGVKAELKDILPNMVHMYSLTIDGKIAEMALDPKTIAYKVSEDRAYSMEIAPTDIMVKGLSTTIATAVLAKVNGNGTGNGTKRTFTAVSSGTNGILPVSKDLQDNKTTAEEQQKKDIPFSVEENKNGVSFSFDKERDIVSCTNGNEVIFSGIRDDLLDNLPDTVGKHDKGDRITTVYYPTTSSKYILQLSGVDKDIEKKLSVISLDDVNHNNNKKTIESFIKSGATENLFKGDGGTFSFKVEDSEIFTHPMTISGSKKPDANEMYTYKTNITLGGIPGSLSFKIIDNKPELVPAVQYLTYSGSKDQNSVGTEIIVQCVLDDKGNLVGKLVNLDDATSMQDYLRHSVENMKIDRSLLRSFGAIQTVTVESYVPDAEEKKFVTNSTNDQKFFQVSLRTGGEAVTGLVLKYAPDGKIISVSVDGKTINNSVKNMNEGVGYEIPLDGLEAKILINNQQLSLAPNTSTTKNIVDKQVIGSMNADIKVTPAEIASMPLKTHGDVEITNTQARDTVTTDISIRIDNKNYNVIVFNGQVVSIVDGLGRTASLSLSFDPITNTLVSGKDKQTLNNIIQGLAHSVAISSLGYILSSDGRVSVIDPDIMKAGVAIYVDGLTKPTDNDIISYKDNKEKKINLTAQKDLLEKSEGFDILSSTKYKDYKTLQDFLDAKRAELNNSYDIGDHGRLTHINFSTSTRGQSVQKLGKVDIKILYTETFAAMSIADQITSLSKSGVANLNIDDKVFSGLSQIDKAHVATQIGETLNEYKKIIEKIQTDKIAVLAKEIADQEAAIQASLEKITSVASIRAQALTHVKSKLATIDPSALPYEFTVQDKESGKKTFVIREVDGFIQVEDATVLKNDLMKTYKSRVETLKNAGGNSLTKITSSSTLKQIEEGLSTIDSEIRVAEAEKTQKEKEIAQEVAKKVAEEDAAEKKIQEGFEKSKRLYPVVKGNYEKLLDKNLLSSAKDALDNLNKQDNLTRFQKESFVASLISFGIKVDAQLEKEAAARQTQQDNTAKDKTEAEADKKKQEEAEKKKQEVEKNKNNDVNNDVNDAVVIVDDAPELNYVSTATYISKVDRLKDGSYKINNSDNLVFVYDGSNYVKKDDKTKTAILYVVNNVLSFGTL